ncbi:MAG TPA: hypothetical protein VJ796_03040 [Acidimicrobiia bacterium]|nr:hypothetical protein [Acidimicrobiia bacterium]
MNQLQDSARLLFRGALLVFVVTIVIGILNGLDVWEPEHNMLLTHVHSGTLGWITLAVGGSVLLMFERALDDKAARTGRQLAMGLVVTVVLYVIAFATGTGIYRPIVGTLLLIVLIWLLVWTAGRYRASEKSTAHLAIYLTVVSLVIGAILGVLLGLFIANGSLPGFSVERAASLGGAHPVSMLIGYLILAGVAITAWQLNGANSRVGRAVAWMLFAAGLIAIASFIFNIEELTQVFSLLQVIAIVTYLVIMWRHLRPGSTGSPFARMAVVFLAVGIGLLVYVVQLFVSGTLDPETGSGPLGVLIAFDHAMFIGVMTNALLAVIAGFAGWTPNRILVWAVNIGVAGFIVGLMIDSSLLKRIFTPILGLALLWAIFTAVPALSRRSALA